MISTNQTREDLIGNPISLLRSPTCELRALIGGQLGETFEDEGED